MTCPSRGEAALGSARFPRAAGVSAGANFIRRGSGEIDRFPQIERARKFVAAGTPQPARGTRALPGDSRP